MVKTIFESYGCEATDIKVINYQRQNSIVHRHDKIGLYYLVYNGMGFLIFELAVRYFSRHDLPHSNSKRVNVCHGSRWFLQQYFWCHIQKCTLKKINLSSGNPLDQYQITSTRILNNFFLATIVALVSLNQMHTKEKNQ